MSDTNVWQGDSSEVTVTIKSGKGYDDSWFVFRGKAASVKEQLIEFFSLDRASVESLSPYEVAVNARSVAQGLAAVAVTLGGTVTHSEATKPSTPATGASTATDDGWGEDTTSPTDLILVKIEAAASVDELKALWADNQSVFADAEVMAIWKAKGKALKAAA